MSNNLNLDQVAENQALKEVTINTATGQLDAALTELLSTNLSVSNITLTSAQYRSAMHHYLTGIATSGRTLTLPAVKKLSIISADVANSHAVAVVRGSTSIALSPGVVGIFYTDGTTNGLILVSQSIAAAPYDVGTFCVDLPGASERLLIFNYVRAVILPANLAGSRVTARVAATAQTDFAVTVNGSTIGNIRFAAAGTVATFVGFSATNIAVNDRLQITAPGTADATLADIAFTIAGTKV